MSMSRVEYMVGPFYYVYYNIELHFLQEKYYNTKCYPVIKAIV